MKTVSPFGKGGPGGISDNDKIRKTHSIFLFSKKAFSGWTWIWLYN
jgi:hypothetical protein